MLNTRLYEVISPAKAIIGLENLGPDCAVLTRLSSLAFGPLETEHELGDLIGPVPQSTDVRGSAFPGRIHPTASVTGMARSVWPFMMAMRFGLPRPDTRSPAPGGAAPEQFHTRHPIVGKKIRGGIFLSSSDQDAASALVSASVSPDRATEVFRSAEDVVSGHRTCGDSLPRLGVFAGCASLFWTCSCFFRSIGPVRRPIVRRPRMIGSREPGFFCADRRSR